MQFASRYPERVDKLIVVDIAPKDYPPSQRHLFNALVALDLSKHRSFLEAEKALAPAIPEIAMRQFLLKNLTRGGGGLRWKIDLDAIVRSYEGLLRRITLEGRCDNPACFLRGGRSSYIEDDDLRAIRRTFPQAEFVTLPDAGHWVHADSPEEFAQTVLNFLDKS